jgi:hypothetical protein
MDTSQSLYRYLDFRSRSLLRVGHGRVEEGRDSPRAPRWLQTESEISVNKRSNTFDQDANLRNHRQNEEPIVEQKSHFCNIPSFENYRLHGFWMCLVTKLSKRRGGHAIPPAARPQLFRDSSYPFEFIKLCLIQGVPPGHEHLNIGIIKLHPSMTFI